MSHHDHGSLPQTDKGHVLTVDRAGNKRGVPLTTDGFVLTVDDTDTNGVKFKAAGGGSGTPSDTVVSETAFGQSATAGVASTYQRGDHTHGTPTDPVPAHVAAADPHTQYALDSDKSNATPTQIDVGDTGVAGTSTSISRDDHQHALPAPTAGYPVDVDMGAETDGTATTVARADHKHHVATPSAGYPTQIDIGDAQTDGTATTPARSDHQHAVPAPAAGYPVNTDFSAEADGTATTVARSDHRHTLTDPTVLPGVVVVGTTTSTEGTDTAPARSDHNHGVSAVTFSLAATYVAPASDDFVVWRAPFACTVTAIKGYQDAGTGSTINAFKGTLAAPTLFRSANLTVSSADTWVDGGAVQNTAVAAGDAIYFRIATVAGAPNEIAIQLDLTRP